MAIRVSIHPAFPMLMLLAVGCSSEGSISGKVTYMGKPLTGGTVLFTTSQGSSSSQIQEDGSYSIPRIPTGAARIAVETKSAQGPQTGLVVAGGAPKKSDSFGKRMEIPPEAAKSSYAQGPPRTTKAQSIPEHYADPDKSDLTYTIKGGAQEFDIELKP